MLNDLVNGHEPTFLAQRSQFFYYFLPFLRQQKLAPLGLPRTTKQMGPERAVGYAPPTFALTKQWEELVIDTISLMVPVKPLEISIFLLDSQLLKAFIRQMLI